MTRDSGIPGSGLWTIARQTFIQCVRTRVAAVFFVLLVASLALLPSLMEGDGTLSGRIRTFLDYSTSVVSVLLALTVVLLSAGLISGDVAGKHVMILCTKPLARWKYVLGRWLGVVMLSGLLLAGSYVAIYLTANYLRGRLDLAVGAQDARAVETEIFAARTSTPAPEPDVEAMVAAEIAKKRQQGSWDAAVRSYMDNYQLSESDAIDKLLNQMGRSAASKAQSAGPGRSLTWNFDNLPYGGERYQAPGIIVNIDREKSVVTFRTYTDMARRLVHSGPIWIGKPDDRALVGPTGSVGRVVRLWRDGFSAVFPIEEMKARFVSAEPGKEVSVVAHPTLQLSYKISAADPNQVYRKAAWIFENPDDGFTYYVPPRDVRINRQATVLVPAAAVGEQGRMKARFINQSPLSVTLLASDMNVLYGLGGFEMNFVRSGLLVLLGLMFLAALGMFASSWMSFSVACLTCFVLLWVSAALGFITDAIMVGPDKGDTGLMPALYVFASWLLHAVKVLLPDLASTMRTNFIVDGMLIPWRQVGVAALLSVGVRGAFLLGLGCLIFHRRELARVQV